MQIIRNAAAAIAAAIATAICGNETTTAAEKLAAAETATIGNVQYLKKLR